MNCGGDGLFTRSFKRYLVQDPLFLVHSRGRPSPPREHDGGRLDDHRDLHAVILDRTTTELMTLRALSFMCLSSVERIRAATQAAFRRLAALSSRPAVPYRPL